MLKTFETIWGTEELLVSFDGANISMPGEMQDPNQPAWYHIDQDPDRRGCLCVQGLVNLNVNVGLLSTNFRLPLLAQTLIQTGP